MKGETELWRISSALVIAAAIVYVQAAAAQWRAIRLAGGVGGLSRLMHQLFLAKDIAACAFGVTMGVSRGWPVMLLACTGLIIQSVTLAQFRWARRRQGDLRSSGGATCQLGSESIPLAESEQS
jgi:hypothetical protein